MFQGEGKREMSAMQMSDGAISDHLRGKRELLGTDVGGASSRQRCAGG